MRLSFRRSIVPRSVGIGGGLRVHLGGVQGAKKARASGNWLLWAMGAVGVAIVVAYKIAA